MDKSDSLRNQANDQYDFGRISVRDARGSQTTDGFRDYIERKLREASDREGDKITRQIISDRTGITVQMVKKIINRGKHTRKRDSVIAICRAIDLDLAETNEALKRYPMLLLNPMDMRDLVIIQGIRKGVDVARLNVALNKAGFNALNVSRGGSQGSEDPDLHYYARNEVLEKEYSELRHDVKVWRETKSDNRVELSSLYDPEAFRYEGYIDLKRQSDGKVISIKYPRSVLFEEYAQIYEDDYDEELQVYDALLNYTIDEKMGYIKVIMDDTRNFGHRYYAKVVDAELVVYGEWFNAKEPERDEYFQVFIKGGKTVFSSTKRSVFLPHYLGKRYKRIYGAGDVEIGEIRYDNIQSISEAAVSKTNGHKAEIAKRLLQYMEDMVKGAERLVEELAERKAVIYEPFNYEEVIRVFGLEEALNCIVSEETDDLAPQKKSATLAGRIEITLDEFYRCAELGVLSVEEVVQVKDRYGSIEGLIENWSGINEGTF